MTPLAWFGTGVAIVASLWWWRFMVRWATFDHSDDWDPLGLFHELRLGDGKVLEGLTLGSFGWLTSPVWVPIYLVAAAVKHRPRVKSHDRMKSVRASYLRRLS